MDLETTFKEVCDGLKLTRNTDRKKNAENLKEYLTRNAVPCMLTHNALRKTGYCWSNVFGDINEYFLKVCGFHNQKFKLIIYGLIVNKKKKYINKRCFIVLLVNFKLKKIKEIK